MAADQADDAATAEEEGDMLLVLEAGTNCDP
jgi:hypothetical protein